MQIKLTAIFAFVLFMLVVLLLRITVITAKSGNQYARQVLSQQSYDSQTIPYRRGEIQDANGIILARSERVYNVVLDCYAINSNEDYIEPTIDAVCSALGLDEADVRDRIENEATRDSQYQVVLYDATEEQKQAYEDYVSLDEDRELSDTQREKLQNVTGVWFEEQYNRVYPYDTLASNVVGFSNDIDQGTCGVEAYYDDLLNGTNGRTFGYLNEDSEFERTTIEPEHGKTLVLTLDMNIQQIIEKYIQEFDETYGEDTEDGKGAKNIGVVVMDPNTGEVLGMATNSEFDLNEPYDLTSVYTGAEVRAMDEDTYVEALNTMWSNFCVSTSFEPGSVVKPITVASALEVGAVSDGDYFYCDGGEFITDTDIHCDVWPGAHGDETLEYAIVNSCNDALMQIGMKMGIDAFCEYQSLFNFGSATGIDLPNENAGVVYNENTMHEVELATCTFGQGYTCNMIQEAAAFSAVINGGYYYQPHVVKQVLNADGSVEKNVEPLLLRQPVSSQVSSLVRGYLETAVQEGTGRKSRVPGYRTGGKTGTAEKIDEETGQRAAGRYLVSFIGAAPINDPEVVVYVVIDEPNVANQADSSYPQILFRQIATELFPYLGLYPTEEITDQLLMELGMTRDQVVEGGTNHETFQAFDTYGNLYNDAWINEEGVVVHGDNIPVEGAYVNEDGNPVDAWGNVKVLENPEENIDPKVDNPDMATPPQDVDDGEEEGTTWDGVTDEDLEDEEPSQQ